jgi:filamentous hemagglutinin family protein
MQKKFYEKTNLITKFLLYLLSFQLIFFPLEAEAFPHSGKIVNGAGQISVNKNAMTVVQKTASLSINWSSFNLAANQILKFIQPNTNSVVFNNIYGNSASTILGILQANGHVWLMNPYGIIFGRNAQINVGGIVAGGLALENGTLYGNGSVVNNGNITVGKNGELALLGRTVSNAGSLYSVDGTILLEGGSSFSKNGNTFLIQNNASGNSVTNSGNITNNSGTILLKAGTKDSLFASSVNTTGTIIDHSVGSDIGNVTLISGLSAGTTTVGGTIDLTPAGTGNGGMLDTSGNRVNVLTGTRILTDGMNGTNGMWIMDPASFYIGKNTGSPNSTDGNKTGYEDISGSQLSADLSTSSITIDSTNGSGGTLGNVYVNAPISWSSGNTLTLNAVNNIEINAPITNTSAYSPTKTLTTGVTIPNTPLLTLRSDDMSLGGTENAGTAWNGTSLTGVPSGVGTVAFNSGGSLDINGPVSIYYNPTNYMTPTTFSNSGTGTVTSYMLVSSPEDFYYLDQNQNATILANSYAMNTNIQLPSPTSSSLTGADLAQVEWATAQNGYTYSAGSSTNSNWTRFGSSSAQFSGNFDGLDNTLSGLNMTDNVHTTMGFLGGTSGFIENTIIDAPVINMDYNTTSSNFLVYDGIVGFGNELYGINVKNLSMNLIENDTGYFSYFTSFTGGIAGSAGLIANSKSSGNINSTMTGNKLNYTQAGIYLGGLVGYGKNIISSSSSLSMSNDAPSTYVNNNYFGGLGGYLYGGNILDSYSSGSLTLATPLSFESNIGGLAGGTDNTTVNNSYSTSVLDMTQAQPASTYFGGLLGDIYGSTTINNSYYNGLIENQTSHSFSGSTTRIGGIIGFSYAAPAKISNDYAVAVVSGFSGTPTIGGIFGETGFGQVDFSHSTFDSSTSGTTAAIGLNTGATITGTISSFTTTQLPSGFVFPFSLNTWQNGQYQSNVSTNPWVEGQISVQGVNYNAPILIPDTATDTVTLKNSTYPYTGSPYTPSSSQLTQTVTFEGWPSSLSTIPVSEFSVSPQSVQPGTYLLTPLPSGYTPLFQTDIGQFVEMPGSVTILPKPVQNPGPVQNPVQQLPPVNNNKLVDTDNTIEAYITDSMAQSGQDNKIGYFGLDTVVQPVNVFAMGLPAFVYTGVNDETVSTTQEK